MKCDVDIRKDMCGNIRLDLRDVDVHRHQHLSREGDDPACSAYDEDQCHHTARADVISPGLQFDP